VAVKVFLLELRHMKDLVQEALVGQEQERATGFASANAALDELLQVAQPGVLALVHELRSGEEPERELAARLLSASALASSVVQEEVREAAGTESDGDVLRWLVFALNATKDPGAIEQLVNFARHEDARVRFGVPDALSSCAARFGDISLLLGELSRDAERDVRWSATYELAAWLTERAPRITDSERADVVSMLRGIGRTEPDAEIRLLAEQAAKGDDLQ
jgi:hypothetical protein